MRVLVSTKESQGTRSSDFSHTQDNELVKWGFECSRDKNNIDGGCGCRRSLVGIDSLKATTTFKVADLPFTKKQYEEAIAKGEAKGGWLVLSEKTIKGMPKWVKEEVDDLLDIADHFPVGTVLEKRGDEYRMRQAIHA